MHAVLVLAIVAGLAVALPHVTEVQRAWRRVVDGDPYWLTLAFAFEVASYAGYIVVFRAIFDSPALRVGWRLCAVITLAGVAASRLLSAAGAGGVALTGWALHRAGMPRRVVAERLATFLILVYGVFMGALVLAGVGLRTGVFAGPAPFALSVVPAVFGAGVIVAALVIALLPRDLDRRVRSAWPADHRGERLAGRIALVPATVASGVRGAIAAVRTGDRRLAGALAWWAFDILVLWAALRAFGDPPSGAVLVMAYFAGQLGNVLPLPGGVGGVEGGMVAALVGFHVPADLAIAGVLAYRAFAFWLPIIPGAFAYAGLRRLHGRP